MLRYLNKIGLAPPYFLVTPHFPGRGPGDQGDPDPPAIILKPHYPMRARLE